MRNKELMTLEPGAWMRQIFREFDGVFNERGLPFFRPRWREYEEFAWTPELERQGIVTRDGVRAEAIPGGYGSVYGELRALETLGLCRRGYFVEGLGGAQFALGGAVERLRELRPRDDEPLAALCHGTSDPFP